LLAYVPVCLIQQQSDKTRVWAAQDFSENELKNETLLAKFKEPAIAEEFEKAFTTAVESSAQSSKTNSKTGNAKVREEFIISL